MKDRFAQNSGDLLAALKDVRAGQLERGEDASAAMKALSTSCAECHKGYRNR